MRGKSRDSNLPQKVNGNPLQLEKLYQYFVDYRRMIMQFEESISAGTQILQFEERSPHFPDPTHDPTSAHRCSGYHDRWCSSSYEERSTRYNQDERSSQDEHQEHKINRI